MDLERLTEHPDSSPHWPEMAVWPCYVQISSDDLFSSTNHLGNPFLNIYLLEQLKWPMSIFLKGGNEVSRNAPEWVANITKLWFPERPITRKEKWYISCSGDIALKREAADLSKKWPESRVYLQAEVAHYQPSTNDLDIQKHPNFSYSKRKSLIRDDSVPKLHDM